MQKMGTLINVLLIYSQFKYPEIRLVEKILFRNSGTTIVEVTADSTNLRRKHI